MYSAILGQPVMLAFEVLNCVLANGKRCKRNSLKSRTTYFRLATGLN